MQSLQATTSPHYKSQQPKRVAYVLKRYPRFSETFVVNEILAHEAAGTELSIFALRPTTDTHFQHAIADVKAPVTYLRYTGIKAESLWKEMQLCAEEFPECWALLSSASGYLASELFQGLELARAVSNQGIEHLHAHFGTSAASVARLASLISGVPYSLTVHAKDIFHEYVDEELLGRKFADAAAVITVSDFNVLNLSERFSESADRIYRLYNGIHLDKFPYTAPANRPAEIVAVGRLVEKKGFCDLVTACDLMRQAGTEFRCQIIGGGDMESALRTQIAELDLGDYVQLVGPQPQQAVLEAIRQAAVCVAPCVTASTGDRDGLPTILLEAMATGTACLATDVTGIPELIEHGRTGLIVSEQDPPALSTALQRLISDRALQGQLSTAARQLIEEQFDIRRNAALQRELFAACRVRHDATCYAEVG